MKETLSCWNVGNYIHITFGYNSAEQVYLPYSVVLYSFIALWSQEYDKTVGQSGDKVKLATQIHDLVRQNICLCTYLYRNIMKICYCKSFILWSMYVFPLWEV